MDSIRARHCGLIAALRFALAASGKARLSIFLAAALFAASTDGFCAGPLPRAQAIVTANQIAAAAERTLRVLPRVAFQIAGLRGRIEAEYRLALLYSAMSADDLADRYWQAMSDDARAAADSRARGTSLIARIETILGSGDYVRGQRINDELMRLAESTRDDGLTAAAEEYQGVLDRRRGHVDTALEHQTRALALRRKTGNAAGEAAALTNLGTIARDKGDFAQCLDYFLQALAIRERIDVRLDVAYRNIALLYRELDDVQTTQSYFDKAVRAATRYAQPGFYASVQGAYAGFLNDHGEFEKALAAAGEALAISEVLGNHPSVGFEHLEVGRALLGLRRPDEAAPHFNEALALGHEIDQRELIARSELALAEIALAHGDLAGTHRLLEEVSPRLNAAGLRPYLAQAYFLRDRLAEAENDPATAHEYTHRHAGLREELLGVRSSRLLAAIEIRKVREQSQQQLELATRTNELQAERIERSRWERYYGLIAILALFSTLAVFAALLIRLRRLNRELAARNEQFDHQHAALSAANRKLEQQASSLYKATITDALTGANSRSHTLSELAALLADCKKKQRDLTLLLIDFDHFKLVNDRYGHLAGDRLLVKAARVIRAELTEECLFGRFGGEEFILAFPDRDESASAQFAERVRRTVAARMAGTDPPTTISIGVAVLRRMPAIHALDQFIDAADRALYAAKQAGRNQVRGL